MAERTYVHRLPFFSFAAFHIFGGEQGKASPTLSTKYERLFVVQIYLLLRSSLVIFILFIDASYNSCRGYFSFYGGREQGKCHSPTLCPIWYQLLPTNSRRVFFYIFLWFFFSFVQDREQCQSYFMPHFVQAAPSKYEKRFLLRIYCIDMNWLYPDIWMAYYVQFCTKRGANFCMIW